MKPYILIVEDEESIAVMLQYNLEKADFEVAVVDNGEDALDSVFARLPDLIILDWMLPIYDGVEVCKRLHEHEETQKVPVIMLTARGEESDRIRGLDSGADDYIVKPFSPKELIARINAVLRRTRPALGNKKLEAHGLEVDLNAYRAKYLGKVIHLGPTEFRLLVYLMEHEGRVFSREQLLDAVWGHDVYVEVRTVDVHVRRLRKALETVSPEICDYIRTVRSAGYMFEHPDKI